VPRHHPPQGDLAAWPAIAPHLIFGWGTVSARLERFDVTAPITFVLASLLLTHCPVCEPACPSRRQRP
jgi:hypothetical protein